MAGMELMHRAQSATNAQQSYKSCLVTKDEKGEKIYISVS
jgi:hypothetical protein